MSTPAPAPSVAAFRAQARSVLPAAVWEYLQEGTQAHSLAAVRLMPRPLASVAGGHTRLTLFGQHLAHPLVLAPVAYQALFHPDAEAGWAMAAAAQGGQSVISSLASQPLDDIVRAAREGQPAHGCTPWFQLYWQADRERTLQLLQRAEAAGCSAVVFTVDAPIKRATLALPAGVAAVNLPEPSPVPLLAPGHSAVFDGWMPQAPTWDDLVWLRQQTRLPLLVKGVLHPDDAARALDAGADGIVVSSHGGRVLAGGVSAGQALPDVCARVRGQVPVLFDSGIRSGGDAVVAIGLGASAVLIGRPAVWALASQGALGVAQLIRVLRDELEMTLALMGLATLDPLVGSLSPAR